MNINQRFQVLKKKNFNVAILSKIFLISNTGLLKENQNYLALPPFQLIFMLNDLLISYMTFYRSPFSRGATNFLFFSDNFIILKFCKNYFFTNSFCSKLFIFNFICCLVSSCTLKLKFFSFLRKNGGHIRIQDSFYLRTHLS